MKKRPGVFGRNKSGGAIDSKIAAEPGGASNKESEMAEIEATDIAEPVKDPDFCPALGDVLVEYLEAMGVEYVFGVPGGSIEPLFNAMARSSRRGGLKPVLARHEMGAACMADGYARETGKLGVCCSTSGPGATNLITGVATSFMDKIPLLVLTAQTALPQFGKWTLQDSSCTAVNTVAMFKHCTRYSSLVSHRGQLETKLVAAVQATQGPPAGPAHLSFPLDLLSSPRRRRPGVGIPNLKYIFDRYETCNPQALETLCAEVVNSSRTLVIVGEDCGEGIDQILEFSELANAAIVSGPIGKRWITHAQPKYRGVLGFAGHPSAKAAFLDERVDLILAVGTRMTDMIFGPSLGKDFQNKLVQIDTTTEHFHRSPHARLHLCGTLGAIFRHLNAALRGRPLRGQLRLAEKPLSIIPAGETPKVASMEYPPQQITIDAQEKCFDNSSPIKPQRLMRELTAKFPDDTRFLIDAGNSWAWAVHYLFPRRSGSFRLSMGFGAMGWAIGASVGTAYGAPGKPVVCITGDGSFLMNGKEITVAVAQELPVVFVILNDQALGMVKHGQRLGGGEPIAFQLPQVDFAKMAQALGAQGITIRSSWDFMVLNIKEILSSKGPTLLDVHIDSEEVPAIGMRMQALGQKDKH